MKTQHSRRRLTLVAAAAAASLMLAACTGGSGDGEGGGQGEEKVLNLWYGSEPGQADAITALVTEWDNAKDDISVKITAMGAELNPPSLLPALSSGEGPDMWVGNVGPGQPQAFIEAGLVKDLNGYYCKLGWGETLPDELAAIATVKDNLYAMPNSIESTGMFYRKSIFEKLNLSIPTTWPEFLAVVDALAANGYETPIGAAGQDAWPVTQLLGAMWGTAAGPEGINETLFGEGSWKDEGFQKATEEFVKLQEKGAFGPEPLAFTYQATMADFYKGDVPMTYTGGFVIPGAKEDAGKNFDDIGVFALPSVTGGPTYANQSPGEGWYVNANTDHADAAADLINHLFFTEASRTKILEGGLIPVGPVNVDEVDLPSVLEELLAENSKYRENGVVPAFLEVLTPGPLFEAQSDGVQGVLAGKADAKQLLDAYQAAWESEKAEGNTLVAGGSPKC